MGATYMAMPKASHSVVEVATSTSAKTLLQVATPSTTDLTILGWGVSFDGTTASDAPGIVELIDVNVAATVTSLTPEKWGSDLAQASLCIGGTAATGYSATVEGTITGSRLLGSANIHPQTGYELWYPEGSQPKVAASRFLRVRATFAVSVNAIPWVVWAEPA